MHATRTYLQLTSPEQLRPARPSEAHVRIEIEQVRECPASFYRYLYREVGAQYHWVDRVNWTDAEILAHLSRAELSLWLMWCDGAPAGYFELRTWDDESVEIAYFGLLPEYIGRGLGAHLLTAAAERAWASGTRRVWLHTCTLDHPAALPNYLKRGFVPFKTETYIAPVTDRAQGESAARSAPRGGTDP